MDAETEDLIERCRKAAKKLGPEFEDANEAIINFLRDFEELEQENARLRAENERLKAGWQPIETAPKEIPLPDPPETDK